MNRGNGGRTDKTFSAGITLSPGLLGAVFPAAIFAALLTASPVPVASEAGAAVGPDWIWVEGEAPAETNITFAHPWYAGAVRKEELSGGAFLAHYGPEPGLATYNVDIPADGLWAFWVRANPTAKPFSYRLDGGEWVHIDMENNQRGRINIAADGGVDLRFIGWAKAGNLKLAKGTHRIGFKFHSGGDNHGSLDCFVLARGPFDPMGKLKPGEKTGLADPGTWAFEPDPDSLDPKALLDLSYLNEKTAGESGFVRLSPDGNGFVLGNGHPVRFWAVNSNLFRHADVAGIERHGRFLAKRGVNMVRAHIQLSVNYDGSKITDVDAATIDDVRRLVAGMKRAGIYTTISPYWAAAQNRVPASWGIDCPPDRDAQALLFFNEPFQEGFKAWLRALYEPVNPYTGVPLAKDPAVAIIQLQNEDSLLFWTVGNLKGAQLHLLGTKFASFLKDKYGSLAAAQKAWGGAEAKEDDFANGYAHILHVWELTQDRPGPAGRRLADQTEFLGRTMHAFNATMGRFLRDDLGCRQLINAGNWRTADQARLLDAERWSYTANDVVAVNRYYGPVHVNPNRPERASYMVEAGDLFTDPSALMEPRELPVNVRHVVGRPTIITESTWTAPMSHTAEAPFLVAAYGSLNGLGGYYWFATDSPEYALPDQKFPFADPAVLGGFPAAALAYRRGDIRQSEPVVHDERTLAAVWSRTPPIISEEQGFDPTRDSGDRAKLTAGAQAVHPLTFLAGRVEALYGGDPSKTRVMDLSKYIDGRAKRIRSVTGELDLDYGAGICTLDAPRVQGAAGFLSKRKVIDLSGVRIESGNEYAVVMAVSLDAEPLKSSAKVLIQSTTVARAHGFRSEPATFKGSEDKATYDGFKLVSLGGPPWNVVKTDATVTIKNPKLREAIVLDSNGIPVRTLKTKRSGDRLTVVLPPGAIYIICR